MLYIMIDDKKGLIMKLVLIISIILFNINNILYAKDIIANYDIKGMMCEMNCPDFIKEEAIRMDGVKKCEVNFDKGYATITFDDEKIDKTKLATILSKNTENMYDIKIQKEESSQSWWNWIFGS